MVGTLLQEQDDEWSVGEDPDDPGEALDLHVSLSHSSRAEIAACCAKQEIMP